MVICCVWIMIYLNSCLQFQFGYILMRFPDWFCGKKGKVPTDWGENWECATACTMHFANVRTAGAGRNRFGSKYAVSKLDLRKCLQPVERYHPLQCVDLQRLRISMRHQCDATRSEKAKLSTHWWKDWRQQAIAKARKFQKVISLHRHQPGEQVLAQISFCYMAHIPSDILCDLLILGFHSFTASEIWSWERYLEKKQHINFHTK